MNPNLGRFTRLVSRHSPASPRLSVKKPGTCFYDDTVIWTRPSENSVIHFSHRVLCRDSSSLPCCIRPLTLLSQLLWLKVCYNRHPTNSATLQRRHISLSRSVPDSDLSASRSWTHYIINIMVSPRESAQRLGPLFLLATTWSSLTLGLDLNLCASFNTADTPKSEWIGLCRRGELVANIFGRHQHIPDEWSLPRLLSARLCLRHYPRQCLLVLELCTCKSIPRGSIELQYQMPRVPR